jgi:hypothetical protein
MNIQNWFMGVVEVEQDPLGMGRVKVRCFGYHNPDRKLLPTSDLPWMQTIFPVTAGPATGKKGSSPTLKINSIVFGAFYDGSDLQDAVILGTVPGGELKQANYDPETDVGFGSAFGPFGPGIPNANGPRNDMISSSVTSVTAPPMASVPDDQYPEPASIGAGAGNSIASTAEGQARLGITEDDGANRDRGGKIQKYWSATTTPNSLGAPWCGAFACWVVKNSGALPEDKLPKSGFSNNWIDIWAKKNSDIVQVFHKGADSGGLQRGDIIVRRKVGDSSGHVSIVTKANADGTFETVDGNYGNSVKKVTGRRQNLGAMTNRHYILRIKDTGVPPNEGLPIDAEAGQGGLPEGEGGLSADLFP